MFVGVEYLVLWLKVEAQTSPTDEGCGKDFLFTTCKIGYALMQ
jgi:hypothetical protein